ncbi:protein serine/threonine kinase protein [Trichomonas vaginalis G3]|uniref:protein serine/threonine kinase protein n=1 Tax=Trichomonas vaginalis (strain ATCC PRA-98 / G3) TaxID=412133 RepID=UPI0021E5F562|nr:protein serine/threonine kinase protein [Trichomonas vaginalis G3]KAI5527530.1 protein serine/threonine kinase protein [Trichomonas vaginalis G3]
MEIAQLQTKLDEHGYIYLDYLGSGAFANCYFVQDKRYNNKFACKVINLQHCDNHLQTVVRKYHIEVESLCAVCHPNIIKIYNYFYDESNLYVIVEYCSNGTLDNWIKTYGAISGRKLFLWVTQFANALASCHDHELAHRDLKPANILFDDDFNIKICDFGLACIHEPISQKYCGNLRYAAPEIKHKKPYDPYKADVWSFGLIVAFMAMDQMHSHNGLNILNMEAVFSQKRYLKTWSISLDIAFSLILNKDGQWRKLSDICILM